MRADGKNPPGGGATPPIVLVHGAHAGAWWWSNTRTLLRQAGHDVHSATLTGLGDRTHLGGPDVGLSTHIDDATNLLHYEDLTDVVLVGCSYGGMVITGVADRVPERLRQLVYVDALVPRDGEAAIDLLGPERRSATLERAGRGEHVIPLGPEADPRLSPHPIKTWLEPIALRATPNIPRSFIRFTDAPHPGIASSAERARSEPGWRYREMAGRHTAARDRPDEFVALLRELIEI